jgi:hypothetical protein
MMFSMLGAYDAPGVWQAGLCMLLKAALYCVIVFGRRKKSGKPTMGWLVGWPRMGLGGKLRIHGQDSLIIHQAFDLIQAHGYGLPICPKLNSRSGNKLPPG